MSDFATRMQAIGAEADGLVKDRDDALVVAGEANRILAETNERQATEIHGLKEDKDRLEQQLADCQNPPPVYTLEVGYCPDPNTPLEVNRLGQWSGATVRRSYLSPVAAGGSLPPTPTFVPDAAAGLRTAHTFKCPVPSGGDRNNMTQRVNALLTGIYDEQIIAYILKSAKDSIWGSEHEPEDDKIAALLWQRGQRHFKRLLVEANERDGGTRLYAGNLMSSTDQPDSWGKWFPGDGVWDICGFDGYNWPNRTPGSTTIPRWVEFEEIFTPDWTRCQENGLGFAIFEFGCRKQDLFPADTLSPPTEAYALRQTDWMIKARRVMTEKFKPEVACYFHHNWWVMRENGHRAMGGIAA